ncbi:MAG: TadE/TadG family type IV pilus assembly protein [Bdellovibrionales bacterium]
MIRNQSGQTAVEFILVTAILVIIAGVVIDQLKSRGIMEELVNGPNTLISGMIQNGVWAAPDVGKQHHPSYLKRHVSLDPEYP